VYAYSSAADVAVTYLVVGGNDTVPMFKINFCSGQLRLTQGGLSALLYPYVLPCGLLCIGSPCV
jgi:hypothetical protein